MNQEPITINASEVSDCEYCEVSWSLSDGAWPRSSRKLSNKGIVAHSEYIRAEEAIGQLARWKVTAKIAIILLILGILIYLLYFLWR